jgi:hypothetical protein
MEVPEALKMTLGVWTGDNQACERTGSSAGQFRCLFLIHALQLHPERGSREPVAPLDRYAS